MKRFKNNLDEMQEGKLLRIEHYGMWLAFWGLFAALMIEVAGGANFKQMAAEWILLMILCFYLVAACLKNGIWDRYFKPKLKTNIFLSLAAAATVAALTAIISLRNGFSGAYLPTILGGVFSAAITFLLCFGALQLSVTLYKKRRAKLENGEEDGNEPC